jgi:hypothetical protein
VSNLETKYLDELMEREIVHVHHGLEVPAIRWRLRQQRGVKLKRRLQQGAPISAAC